MEFIIPASFSVYCSRLIDGQENHGCVISFDPSGLKMDVSCCQDFCVIGEAGKSNNIAHSWQDLETIEFFSTPKNLYLNQQDRQMPVLKIRCDSNDHSLLSEYKISSSPTSEDGKCEDCKTNDNSIKCCDPIWQRKRTSSCSTPVDISNTQFSSPMSLNFSNIQNAMNIKMSLSGLFKNYEPNISRRSKTYDVNGSKLNSSWCGRLWRPIGGTQNQVNGTLESYCFRSKDQFDKSQDEMNEPKSVTMREMIVRFGRVLHAILTCSRLEARSNSRTASCHRGTFYGSASENCNQNPTSFWNLPSKLGFKFRRNKTIDLFIPSSPFSPNKKIRKSYSLDALSEPLSYVAITVSECNWLGSRRHEHSHMFPLDVKRCQYWLEMEEFRAKDLYKFLIENYAYMFFLPTEGECEDEACVFTPGGSQSPVSDGQENRDDKYQFEYREKISPHLPAVPKDYMRLLLENDTQTALLSQSNIFTMDLIMDLKNHFPGGSFFKPLRLIFTTNIHGRSLMTFIGYFSKLKHGPCVVVMKEGNGRIFGAILSHNPTFNKRYYGNEECAVFTKPTGKFFEVFHSTGNNKNFIHLTCESFQVGGGKSGPAIYIHSDMFCGRSSKSETFDNVVLSEKADFKVHLLECWKFM